MDFVGEYHLDLIVRYGGCPVIVPRVANVVQILDAFEPIHGVLLTEGEDVSDAFRSDEGELDGDMLAAIREAHPGDTVMDCEKDSIEFELARRCIQRGVPLFGVCRGSQIINLSCGGSLLLDIDALLPGAVKHIDYDNYDAHRHLIDVVAETPLARWFDDASTLNVNSYHHQGVRRLASRLRPMAYAEDGVVEGFYDPDQFCPREGRFLVGLQFHPERMVDDQQTYQYPGCPRPYEDFIHACRMYKASTASAYENVHMVVNVGGDRYTGTKRDLEMLAYAKPPSSIQVEGVEPQDTAAADIEAKRTRMLQAFSLASAMYRKGGSTLTSGEKSMKLLSRGAEFLSAASPLTRYSKDELNRLARAGATVHGAMHARALLSRETDDGPLASAWNRFHRAMIAAELALGDMRDSREHVEAAELRLSKLSEWAARLTLPGGETVS